MIAGLISETVRRVCKADMNDVMFFGEGVDVVSSNNDCKGVEIDGRWLRVKVCFKEANPLATEEEGGGEGGRLEARGGEDGVKALLEPLGGIGRGEGEAFFLPAPNERRKDHSDSN